MKAPSGAHLKLSLHMRPAVRALLAAVGVIAALVGSSARGAAAGPVDWASVVQRLSGIPDKVGDYAGFVDHLYLGIAYANLGQVGPAARQFRCIADAALSPYLERVLASSLEQTSARGDDVMAWNCLAFAYYARENYAEASACFERLTVLDPSNVWVRIYLGYSLGRAGRLDDAIATLKAAVAMDPRNEYAHLVLGLAYKEKGLVFQAFLELLKAPHAIREVNEFR